MRLNLTISTISNREYSVSSLVDEEVNRLAVQTAMDLSQVGNAEIMSSGRELSRLWLLDQLD